MATDLEKHIVPPGEGEQLRWGGPAAGGVTILVDPSNTGETSFCVLTQSLDPGAMVPPHHHERAEQVLFVMSGRGAITLGDHEVEAISGAAVHVPKGTVHSITNTGDEPLTILEATSPPGFQEIFREMHRVGEPTLEDIVQMGARHDINMHPDGDS
jgi:mannose-6-phosphate isomerase-like protein (cupin superfamily)